MLIGYLCTVSRDVVMFGFLLILSFDFDNSSCILFAFSSTLFNYHFICSSFSSACRRHVPFKIVVIIASSFHLVLLAYCLTVPCQLDTAHECQCSNSCIPSPSRQHQAGAVLPVTLLQPFLLTLTVSMETPHNPPSIQKSPILIAPKIHIVG